MEIILERGYGRPKTSATIRRLAWLYGNDADQPDGAGCYRNRV
jgi:hypothetical protein